MKRIFHSTFGKVTVFILLVLFFSLTAVSVAGKLFFIESDMSYMPEETYIENHLSSLVRSQSDDILWNYLYDSGDLYSMKHNYSESRTNLRLRLSSVSPEGEELLFTNTEVPFDTVYDVYYTVCTNGEDVTGENVTMWDQNSSAPIFQQESEENADWTRHYYHMILGMDPELPVKDHLYRSSYIIHLAYSLEEVAIPVAAVSGVLTILLFAVLMSSSARRPDSEELAPGPLNRIPFDLLSAAVFGLGALCFVLATELPSGFGFFNIFVPGYLFSALCLLAIVCLAFAWCMSAAARIKQGNLLTNTVCWRVSQITLRGSSYLLRLLASLIRSIPFIWKALFLAFALFLIKIFAILDLDRFIIFLLECFTGLLAVYCIYAMWKLKRGASLISEGNYDQPVDSRFLLFGFKEHADTLSRISSGLNNAVEARLKSERMKTELITNVSHDIKTPLTSIINYSDLISKEPTDNETIHEYSDVLHRQSVKLKRLIEDLIEASKASTGNIEILPEPCDLNVILSQVSAEYEERLQKADLTLITKLPEDQVPIMADGRRLWRVFDNLMNNIIKYALTGTRVYITMVKQNGEAILVFKNTSRDPIDLTPEELTERFVRGDESRNTEGNGLGLSIAKSLVELQKGEMNLYSDGDLFKVILRFPLIPYQGETA